MSKTVFNSVFRSEFQELITLKRSLGFKYQTEEKAFKRIDEYLCTTNLKEKTITKELCVKWCQKRSYKSAANHCNRISSLRVFCKYLCGIGFSAYVPPKGITNHPPKYNAHIYTDDELKRYEFSDTGIGISEIVKRIRCRCDRRYGMYLRTGSLGCIL